VQRYIITVRQSAEWGVGALQKSFRRLQAGLPANDQKRQAILRLATGLYNLRTRWVGINQIRSVYLGPLQLDLEADRVASMYGLDD